MVMKGQAFYTREHETNLAVIRTEENYTVREVCEKTGVTQTAYTGLQNGMISPFYLCGSKDIRPWVKKILKFLDCTFEEAFPRYTCELLLDLTPCQKIDILYSDYSYNQVDLGLKIDIHRCLCLLPRRNRVALYGWFYEGKTLDEIGTEFDVTRERARQIIMKGLRMLRHPNFSRGLKGYVVTKASQTP